MHKDFSPVEPPDEELVARQRQEEVEASEQHVADTWNMLDENKRRILLSFVVEKNKLNIKDTVDFPSLEWDNIKDNDLQKDVKDAIRACILSDKWYS